MNGLGRHAASQMIATHPAFQRALRTCDLLQTLAGSRQLVHAARRPALQDPHGLRPDHRPFAARGYCPIVFSSPSWDGSQYSTQRTHPIPRANRRSPHVPAEKQTVIERAGVAKRESQSVRHTACATLIGDDGG
jgi:hypothetical protein